ncbi:hypothetical protein [uncultured Methanofollis sp.]|mgnify:CR=1 FL=1|uniref:hypothetical protein n=1 Tax=uncultured Methanofollis sp. TaxID=262500 RepID=UPI0026252173|nr:hypothetical protein [uncultured Methanofollis sp.]
MEQISKNAEKILYALAGSKMRQYSGKELSEMTGLAPAEVSMAVRELQKEGAIDVHIRASSDPYTFTSIAITPKGRVIIQDKDLKTPHCDT